LQLKEFVHKQNALAGWKLATSTVTMDLSQ